MSTSAIGTILDAIRAALVLREGMDGVNVFSGPVKLEEAGEECIAFGDASLEEVEMAMGGVRSETWTVEGEIRVAPKAWQGSTEEGIAAVRDRLLAVFAELETHLNDTYVSELPVVTVTEARMMPDIGGDGRTCWLSFELTVQAAKNP